MRTNALDSTAPSAWRRSAPVVALLLLSPVIGEILFGATRITTIFVLAPQVGTWGCAALIIRDVVRRRRRGWTAILLLGIALAVGEECLIQQTSLAPLVGADLRHPYGRALGVNWVYFLWALGYESIWVVVLPIQLTELIFPSTSRRTVAGKAGPRDLRHCLRARLLGRLVFLDTVVRSPLFPRAGLPCSLALGHHRIGRDRDVSCCRPRPTTVFRARPRNNRTGAPTVAGRARGLCTGVTVVCPGFPRLWCGSNSPSRDPVGRWTRLGWHCFFPDRALGHVPLPGKIPPVSRSSLEGFSPACWRDFWC